MPNCRIELARRWGAAEKERMAELLHEALVAALKTPPHDRLVRIVEHDPGHLFLPADCSDNYALVEVTLFPGRTVEAKRALYLGVVERFATLGIDPREVRIVLHEVAPENWGLRGGIAGCDL